MGHYTAINSHHGSGIIDYRHKSFVRPPLPAPPMHHTSGKRAIPRKPGQVHHQKSPTRHKALENLIYQQDSAGSAGRNAPVTVSALSGTVPDFLENAFAQMQHDRNLYVAEEVGSRDAAQRLHHQQTRIFPRDTSARANTNTAQRLPAAAATHPTYYNQHQKQQTPKMLLTPSPEPPDAKQATQEAGTPNCGSNQQEEPPSPDRRYIFTDPRRLQSTHPPCWTPVSGIHPMDTNVHQPKVLSVVFMIGLPFGDQIEIANDYTLDAKETKV